MSELAKPTPGPWHVSAVGAGFEIESASGVSVGQAHQTRPIRTAADHDERRANAHLLASAPELLEALKACDEAIAYMSDYDIPLNLPQMVKDAIAKATGGKA